MNSALRYLVDNARAGGQIVEENQMGTIVYHPYINWPIFSWALLHPHTSPTMNVIQEMITSMGYHGRQPSFIVPEPWKNTVGPLLDELGLRPHDLHHVYMAESERVLGATMVNPDVQVTLAPDPHAWLELLLDGFEVPEATRPPFRQAHAHLMVGDPRATLYEALIGGDRVGAALLWYENGVAGMNTATVRPEFRQRGVHKALFAARIHKGLELGAKALATETGQPPVERVASQWGLCRSLSFRMWY